MTLTDQLKSPEWRAEQSKLFTPVVMHTMRVLKGYNPADTYLENYYWHFEQHRELFFDHYHLAWIMGCYKPPKRILEIGTRTGISICQLLSAYLYYNDVQAICFDLFDDGFISEKLVQRNLKALNIPQEIVTFVKGDSRETVPDYLQRNPEAQFDWVLVDGGHEREVAWADLENVWQAVEPGGLLIFDDISPTGCGLIDVWDRFKEAHPDEFDYCEDMNGKGTAWGVRQ